MLKRRSSRPKGERLTPRGAHTEKARGRQDPAAKLIDKNLLLKAFARE